MEENISKKSKERYEKTRDILKNTPRSERYYKLLELGFEYIEEECDSTEKQEEDNAKPLNSRQKILAKYFDDNSCLSSDIIEYFITEIEGDDTNYPLFRKYFKQGGESVFMLLKEALAIYPSRSSLINALGFFSEHNKNAFSELVSAYNNACKIEKNISFFEELVKDFYMNVSHHDYDVFLSLRGVCQNDKQKLSVVKKIEEDLNVEYDLQPNFH